MSRPVGSVAWYARDDSSGTLSAFDTDDFPDGTTVGAAEIADGRLAELSSLWSARYEPRTGRLLNVVAGSRARSLWYVETPEPQADPPAVTLVAFDTTHFPPGRVIDHLAFVPLPIRSDQQVAAIRWWPGTGQIHQVYVHPLRRRQGIGTAMLYAASAHLVAGGSPHQLWASGDRTDLGESLAVGLPYPHRARARRRSLPPMTPAEEVAGVPERNLFPSL